MFSKFPNSVGIVPVILGVVFKTLL